VPKTDEISRTEMLLSVLSFIFVSITKMIKTTKISVAIASTLLRNILSMVKVYRRNISLLIYDAED